MTPPDDVSTKLQKIRERVEAATDEACPCCGGAFYWKGPGESAVAKTGDVPYLLSLVEDIGEALAEFSIDHMDEEVLAPLEQAGRPGLATVLAQVRDAALKAEYDAALRDAAQEGAE